MCLPSVKTGIVVQSDKKRGIQQKCRSTYEETQGNVWPPGHLFFVSKPGISNGASTRVTQSTCLLCRPYLPGNPSLYELFVPCTRASYVLGTIRAFYIRCAFYSHISLFLGQSYILSATRAFIHDSNVAWQIVRFACGP